MSALVKTTRIARVNVRGVKLAVIDQALTTLVIVKRRLGITVNDYDTQLEDYINRASILIRDYFGFSLKRQEYTEPYKPTNSQWLTLNQYPVQSITYIKFQDTDLTAGTDYQTATKDLIRGYVYKDNFWSGNTYVAGVSYVPLATKREYEVKYIAGWYLPGDIGYVIGADNSLPLTISDVCELIVSNTFRMDNEGRQGLKSTSQGGISYTYITGSDQTNVFSTGMDDILAGKLNLILARRILIA